VPRPLAAVHPPDGAEEPAALRAFAVRVDQSDRLRVVAVEGEVDILTIRKLAAAVDDDGFDVLVLDLGKVSFMSSAGLGLIVSLHRRLLRRGGGLALAAVQRHVASVLEITGLADTLVIAADVPAAVERLACPAPAA
jgi:anti-sigma B factor antagonist